jgi:hypothetical protein
MIFRLLRKSSGWSTNLWVYICSGFKQMKLITKWAWSRIPGTKPASYIEHARKIVIFRLAALTKARTTRFLPVKKEKLLSCWNKVIRHKSLKWTNAVRLIQVTYSWDRNLVWFTNLTRNDIWMLFSNFIFQI